MPNVTLTERMPALKEIVFDEAAHVGVTGCWTPGQVDASTGGDLPPFVTRTLAAAVSNPLSRLVFAATASRNSGSPGTGV